MSLDKGAVGALIDQPVSPAGRVHAVRIFRTG